MSEVDSKITMAMAGFIDVGSNKRIWIPPTGRPYWIISGRPNAGPDLTDTEIERYLKKYKGKKKNDS